MSVSQQILHRAPDCADATVATTIAPAERQGDQAPLVLDLDGTLLRTDLLYESFVAYLRHNPLGFWRVFGWVLKGKAHVKRELAAAAPLDLDSLPVNEDVAAYAVEARASGREVYLATAADGDLARRIAARFPFLTGVIASDGVTNLKGGHKAEALAAQFPDGFSYAGDCRADLAVWRTCREIVLVGASPAVEKAARAIGEPVAVFPRPPSGLKVYAKALRLHQWAKNLLIFVPLILGGKTFDPAAWGATAAGFLALGLLASATYLLNDLTDLPDDRRHWSKRERPLAKGSLPIRTALILAPLGLAVSFGIGAALGPPALVMLGLYLALTLAYSLRLKREPIVDGFVLACLFTLRLGFGIVLAQVVTSPWLLTFSMFLFLSLSFAKRHTEVERMVQHGIKKTAGRGYRAGDGPLLLAVGASAGVGSVLVMVLYLIQEAFPAGYYTKPAFLWAFPAVLFLWVGRVWLLCQRGELKDDPVAFALKDRTSIALGGVMAAAFLASHIGQF
ncbi:UbiA family prenyltransferase [Chelatococcus asaccharovorans]|uniref:UbiA family prenyltransferase n=1 Tax=Chelatococcus asaccharovorans TaxID=28210 RepID=UPI00224C6929|nr:UbiA family prenyltransferase [Chelatococcus asaccharovorans]CAH1671393.1 4-hydroxybenzoate polyprenyltransferase [Chelatococcus asaccharovorans]CAH1677179.1 4-hydroxybenzoate polyprenyltransferase [Chelatococcus asaccharovorans]